MTRTAGGAGVLARVVGTGRVVNMSYADNWISFDQFSDANRVNLILGAVYWADTPTEALIYTGNSGYVGAYTRLVSHLQAAGATAATVTSAWPGSLAGYRIVFLEGTDAA